MIKKLLQRFEVDIFDPFKVGAALSGLAATGLLLSLLLVPWSRVEYAYFIGDAFLAYLMAAVNWIWRHRLPEWTLHINVVIYIVIVTAVTIVGSRHGFDFSRFFTWIAIFSALYMPRRALAFHVALIGVALTLVMIYSRGVTEPDATWVITFVTTGVMAGIVSHLVMILRRDRAQDVLTRLANRRTWDERVAEEIERARRSGGTLSVAVIDIDDFKSVNDRDGHAAGDKLLQAFAHEWSGVVRGSGDLLARLGGDEFGVLAPATDEHGVRRLVARLAEAAPGGVTCSIGVATWNRTESPGEFVRRADEAMYSRKRTYHSSRSARPVGPDEERQ